MMQTKGRLRWALIVAVILMSPALRGGLCAAEESTGAGQSAGVEARKTESSVQEKADQKVLERANAAFESGDFLEANLLYTELVEKNVSVPGERYETARGRAEKLYERAVAQLQKARAALQNWRIGRAQEALAAAKKTGVGQVDDAVGTTITDLHKDIQALQPKVRNQRSRANQLLDNARRATASGRFAQAKNALGETRELAVYDADPAIQNEVADVQSRIETAEAVSQTQKMEADRILAAARKQLDNGKTGAADHLVAEVETAPVYQVEEDVQAETDRMRALVDKRLEAMQERREEEAAEVAQAHGAQDTGSGRTGGENAEVTKERAKAKELMSEANKRLDNGEFKAAMNRVQDLKGLQIFEADEGFRATVLALERRVRAGQQRMAQMKEEVSGVLASASSAIEAWQLKNAAKMLHVASQSPIMNYDAELKNRMKALRQDLADARTSLSTKRQEAANLLEQASVALEKGDVDGARKGLAEVKESELLKVDDELAGRADQLAQEISDTQQEETKERAEAEELLAGARQKVEESQWDEAAAVLGQLESHPAVANAEDLQDRVRALKEKVEQGQKTAAAEEKAKMAAAKKQQAISGKLEEAQTLIEEDDFEKARAILAGVEDSKLYESDESVRQEADALQTELKNKRAAAERDEKKKRMVAELLEQSEKELDQDNLGAAEKLLADARQTEVYLGSPDLREQARRLAARIKEKKTQSQEEQQFRRILAAAKQKIDEWEFDKAAEMLDVLEKTTIYEEKVSVRNTLNQVRQDLHKERALAKKAKEKAMQQLQTASESINAGAFGEAEKKLTEVEKSEVYERNESLRERFARLSRKLTEGRKSDAFASYRQAQEAYENGNYPEALKHIQKVEKAEVSLSGGRARKLSAMRDEVEAGLQQCEKLHAEAKRLYENRKYAEAKEVLGSLEALEFSCPSSIQEDVKRYRAGIEEKIMAQKVAEARRYEQAIEKMEEDQQDMLEDLRERKERRQKAKAAVKEAQAAWEAQQYQRAKEELLDAQKALKALPTEKDAELQQMQEKVESRLRVVNEKIAEEQRREQLRNRLDSMLSKVAEMAETDLQAAEKKMLEALNFAEGNELELNASQKSVVAEVNEAVGREFGQQRRRRADRHWELVSKSETYGRSGDWYQARNMLSIVEDAGRPFLREQRIRELEQRLDGASAKLENQERAMNRVTELGAEAKRALRSGQGPEALQKYQSAIAVARDHEIPMRKLVGILKGYQDSLSESRPEVLEDFVSQLKNVATEKIQTSISEKPYILAREYMNSGAFTAAKPYLQQAARTTRLDSAKRQWAENELSDIDKKIRKAEEERLLALHDSTSRVYQIQKQLQDALQGENSEKIERLRDKLTEARVQRLRERIDWAMNREALPALAKVIEENEDLVDQHLDESLIDRAVTKVEKWERIKSAVQTAESALRQRDSEKAGKMASELNQLSASGTPYAKVVEHMRGACRALVKLEAQKQTQEQRLSQTLAEVKAMLSQAQARNEALSAYTKACELYAAGEWTEALNHLKELSEMEGQLKPLEAEHVEDMTRVARERLESQKVAEITEEAEQLLSQAEEALENGQIERSKSLVQRVRQHPAHEQSQGLAQRADSLEEKIAEKSIQQTAEQYEQKIESRIENRHYRQAAQLIAEAKQGRAHQQDGQFRQQISKFEQQVEAAEEKAAELYQKSVAAYEAGQKEELQKLLKELKAKYENTEVYRKNL